VSPDFSRADHDIRRRAGPRKSRIRESKMMLPACNKARRLAE
jgi:hypothetical protein